MADYQYNSDDGWSDPQNEDNQQDDTQIEIQNNYYEAQEIKEKKPKEALERFQNVVMMEESTDRFKWQLLSKYVSIRRFKSLQSIVHIYAVLKDSQKLLQNHRKLLKLVNQINRNQATQAIDNAMESINLIKDPKMEEEFYSITLNTLKNSNQKLWFNLNLKLIKLHLNNEAYEKVFLMSEQLKQRIKSKQQNDQTKSQLIEVLAAEIAACEKINDHDRIKILQNQVAPLMTAAMIESRPVAIIRESSGKIAMRNKNWDKALEEFHNAFQLFQEIGDFRAKQILKYLVLAGILSGSEINPFESKQAKAFKDDPQIIAMINLRDSYEQNDIFATRKVIDKKENHIKDDPFLAEYLGDLFTNIEMNVLSIKVKSYSRVKLESLGRAIGQSPQKTEKLLSSLILDHRVSGMIDQIDGYFIRDVTGQDGPLQDAFTSILGSLQMRLQKIQWNNL